MASTAAGNQRGIALKRVLVFTATLALLVLTMFWHAQFVLGQALAFAFPDWQAEYQGVWPMLAGGVSARNLRLTPPDAVDGDDSIRFATLRLDIPFLEYWRSAFTRKRATKLSLIHELRLELDDGHGELEQPFTSELAVFGDRSAAPFEAEGCRNDSLWTEAELAEMGLAPRGAQLVMEYKWSGGHLEKHQILHAPGLGRVDFRREMNLAMEGNSISLDAWHVEDEGFVELRNRFCARKDKVDTNAFVDRHVDSVKRLLESIGLAPSPELEQAYRRYASGGRAFDLVVHYDPPLGGPVYDSNDLGTWLPRLHGTFAVDGREIPLALVAQPMRALPEDEVPTYALLEHEREMQTQDAPADAAAPTDVAAAAPSAAARAAAVPAVPAERTEPPAAAPTPVIEVKAPQVADAAAPEPAWITKYADLASHVGQPLTLFVRGHPPVRVQVMRVADAGAVVVRRQFASGDFEFTVDRSRFDHAEP